MHSSGSPWWMLLTACFLIDQFASLAAADAQCYAINGQKSSGTPCNSAASGQPGSHASCCDESKQEACLATGLCYATQRSDNNTFWAEGCTDPTGLDPSCPQYCGTASQFVAAPIQSTYTVYSCGGSTFCCCFESFGKSCSKNDCCSRNFTLARGLGAVVRQFTATADTPVNGSTVGTGGPGSGSGSGSGDGSSSSSSSSYGSSSNGRFDRGQRLVTAIVAGVLGSLLLASLVAFGFSFSRARHLRRQVDRLLLQTAQQQKELTAFSSSSMSSLPPTSPANALFINTQGLTGQGGVGVPRRSTAKDDIVSPGSYEQQQSAGVARSSSTSFHQWPPQPSSAGPVQQQPLPYNHYAPQTPSWPRNGSFSQQSIDGAIGAGSTAELASPAHVSELPTEKYMG